MKTHKHANFASRAALGIALIAALASPAMAQQNSWFGRSGGSTAAAGPDPQTAINTANIATLAAQQPTVVDNGGGSYTIDTDGTGPNLAITFIAPSTASELPVVPAGNLSATDVQAALEELQLDIDALILDMDDQAFTSTDGSITITPTVQADGTVDYDIVIDVTALAQPVATAIAADAVAIQTVAAALISTDAGNGLIVGTDGLLMLDVTALDAVPDSFASATGSIANAGTADALDLDVVLSTDAGNTLTFGTDGGVMSAPAAVSTIYSADDTISGNRVVTLGENNLTFLGDTSEIVHFDDPGIFTVNASQGAVMGVTGASSVSVDTGGIGMDFDPADDLQIDGDPGAAGEVLSSQGPGLPPIWSPAAGGDNIYTADGSLTGNRVVDLNNLALRLGVPLGGGSVTIQSGSSRLLSTSGNQEIEVNNGGIDLNFGPRALNIDGDPGVAGQILTSNGNLAAPTWETPAGGDSIYTADGALTASRTASLGANNLTFVGTGSEQFNVNNPGSVAINAANISQFGLAGSSFLQYNGSGLFLGFDPDDDLRINGTAGTAGQVLSSQGPGFPPIWANGGASPITLADTTADANHTQEFAGFSQTWNNMSGMEVEIFDGSFAVNTDSAFLPGFIGELSVGPGAVTAVAQGTTPGASGGALTLNTVQSAITGAAGNTGFRVRVGGVGSALGAAQTHVDTVNIGNNTATNGMVLTLMDAGTGEAEWQTSVAPPQRFFQSDLIDCGTGGGGVGLAAANIDFTALGQAAMPDAIYNVQFTIEDAQAGGTPLHSAQSGVNLEVHYNGVRTTSSFQIAFSCAATTRFRLQVALTDM